MIMLILLNISDLFFTIYALSLGYSEANAFMQDPKVMVIYKLAVIPILAWILQRLNARRALAALALVYGIVNLWHIYGLFLR